MSVTGKWYIELLTVRNLLTSDFGIRRSSGYCQHVGLVYPFSNELQTCDGERVDDGGDDEVGRGEVGDESASDVVAGRSSATANLLYRHRRDDSVRLISTAHVLDTS